MTDNEILGKAIEKALNNKRDVVVPLIPTYALELANPDKVVQAIKSKRSVNDIIFDHSFAKAFFTQEDEHSFHKDDAWKYYLQHMVLEEHPLQYLEKFL